MATPSAASSPLATPAAGTCTTWQWSDAVNGNLNVEWSIVTASGACHPVGTAVPNDAQLKVRATLNREAWLSIGWNTGTAMVGTDAVLGENASPGGNTALRDVMISGKSLGGVANDGNNDVTGSVSTSGGSTVLVFTRPLTGTGGDDMDLLPAAQSAGSVQWIWAYGSAAQMSLAQHAGSARGGKPLQVAAAAVGASPNPTPAATPSPMATPSAASTPLASPAAGTCTTWQFNDALTSALNLEWSIVTASGACHPVGTAVPNDAQLKVRATLTGMSAWLAIGWNSQHAMVGTDAVVGVPASSAVRDTSITGKSVGGVVNDATNHLTDAAVSTAGGNTVLVFTRALNTGDSSDFNLLTAAQATVSSVRFVWAHGAAGATNMAYHGANQGSKVLSLTSATQCAAGLVLGASGNCEVEADTAATVPLVFTGGLATVAGAADSAARTAFLNSLEAEIETALGMAPAGGDGPVTGRVAVTAVTDTSATTPGTFRVEVTILPLVGSAPPAATGANATAGVDSLANLLAAQLADTSSPVYQGTVTGAALATDGANTDAAVGFTDTPSARVQPRPTTGCAEYNFEFDVDGTTKFEWSLATAAGACLAVGDDVPDDATLAMRVTLQGRQAWVAVGWNDAEAMVGTDAILGLPPATVRDVDISGKSTSGVGTDATQNVPGATVAVVGGSTVLTFTRPLNTGDSEDMNLLASTQAEESVTMVWARGGAGQTGLANHGGTNRGFVTVVLATGDASATDDSTIRLVHGIFMTLSWGIMVPLGVLSAVLLRPNENGKLCGMVPPVTDASQPQTWFVLHWRFQLGAFLFAIIAFILAMVFTTTHFASAHAALGMVVFIFMTLHVGAGLARPHKPPAGEPSPFIRVAWEWGHFIVGRSLPLLALVAMILGWLVFGADAGVAAGVPIAVTVVALVGGYFGLPRLLPAQLKVSGSGAATAEMVPMGGSNPLHRAGTPTA